MGQEAAVKRARREVRRVVGERGVLALEELGKAVESLARGMDDLNQRHAVTVKAVRLLNAETNPLRRGFWGRVKWLVRGK